MERRKSGRDPRKTARRARRIHRILNSFALLSLPRQSSWHTNNDRSRHPPVTPRRNPKDRRHLRPRLCVFMTLSRAFISIFGFSPRLLSRNRESMGKRHETKSGSKWLSDFHFLASLTLVPFLTPNDLALPRFSTFPQECEETAPSCVFSRG